MSPTNPNLLHQLVNELEHLHLFEEAEILQLLFCTIIPVDSNNLNKLILLILKINAAHNNIFQSDNI